MRREIQFFFDDTELARRFAKTLEQLGFRAVFHSVRLELGATITVRLQFRDRRDLARQLAEISEVVCGFSTIGEEVASG